MHHQSSTLRNERLFSVRGASAAAAIWCIMMLSPLAQEMAEPQPGSQMPVQTEQPASTEQMEAAGQDAQVNGLAADEGTAPAEAMDQPPPAAGDTVPDTAVGAPEPSAASEGELPMIETGLDHDLSPLGMFMAADYIVKGVMLGLLAAAIVTWIVLVAKWLQLSGARTRARRVLRAVTAADSLSSAAAILERRRGVAATMVKAAKAEFDASSDLVELGAAGGLKERITSSLSRIEVAAGRKISQGTGILASIGSVGPFVGLFGTVWGIMNSFIGIAESQTTNLAVVAPGIAEALLATAFGLVAAIPAVIIYNGLARSITGYRQLLADVSAAIERLASRDLDRHQLARLTSVRSQAAE